MSATDATTSELRRAGDPRLSPTDRAILLRMTTGDLVDEFQSSLDETAAADPALGGARQAPSH